MTELAIVASGDDKPVVSGRPDEVAPGIKPLSDPRRERFAEWLATPKSRRLGPRTEVALCEELGVSRQLLWIWQARVDVIERALFLADHKAKLAKIIARRELPEVVEAVAEIAKTGNVGAADFIVKQAFRGEEDADPAESQISLRQVIRATEGSGELPSWLIAQEISAKTSKANGANGNGNGTHGDD